jgi:hypothetical protein
MAHGGWPNHFGNTALKRFAAAAATAFALTAGSAQAATLSTEHLTTLNPFDSVFSTASLEKLTSAPEATGAVHVINLSRGPTSRLPEPSTWAMLIMGFGAAGAAMRRRNNDLTYRLEECVPHGGVLTEEFVAPDDAAALHRAVSVVDGDFKLWRGDVLVRG